MNTATHIAASTAVSIGLYLNSGSTGMALSAFVSGIFIDIDHILDFFLFSGERFSIKVFTSWCYEGRWNRLILIFHSYELYAAFVVMTYLNPHPILLGISYSVGLHLALDQAGNRVLIKAFKISPWFYFLTFRAWGGFRSDWMRTPRLS